MGIFSKPSFSSDKKREFPEGLWQKCPGCEEMIHNLELVQNFRVCPKCEDEKLARYRPEVLTDSNYYADEPIDVE